ncbi:MAG: arsenate reductase family protein [Actinobacteria bacterium]|nr:arsenate reductase family protein [Actinomycetota bacterium]
MAVKLVLYHNPSCSKSRGADGILKARGADYQTVRYLDDPLTEDELKELLDILDDPPAALVRKDPHFKSLGLDAADYTDRDSVAALLAAHPRLMERPVVVKGDRAVIGRPPERIEALL